MPIGSAVFRTKSERYLQNTQSGGQETTKEPDELFTQGCAANKEQDHWTTEEVEEHLTTARTVNNDQAQSMKELISTHKRLAQAYDLLEHQLMNVNACMKDLRQLTFGYASTLRSARAAVVEATNVGMHNQRRVTRNMDKTAAMHQAASQGPGRHNADRWQHQSCIKSKIAL